MMTYFKNSILLLLFIYCSLIVFACSNGDSSSQGATADSASTAATIQGSAVKGPIDGAEMKLFYFNADGQETEIVAANAPVVTAASGAFEFRVDPADLEDIHTPLILRSQGGSMYGHPAPVLETLVSDPDELRTADQPMMRHLTTASSVASSMLRYRTGAAGRAPRIGDANDCIAKVEDVFDVDLKQDPADETQGVGMVNLNVDYNLDLFNTPANGDSVEEYIEYLARNLNSSSGELDEDMDDPEHPGEDMEADFGRFGHGRLARLCPEGPSGFLNLMAKVDKATIAGDGIDAATIFLKLFSGHGRLRDDHTHIDLQIISGQGELSDSSPSLKRGRARVTLTSTVPGEIVIQASYTLNNGNTIVQEIMVEVLGTEDNTAPEANAGNDQQVPTGSVVTLDGSQSSDLNNDPLSYSWTLRSTPSGSSATLSDASVFDPTFTADVDGTYIAELVVNDGTVDSQPSTVTVTSTSGNVAPTANPGPDQHVATGSAVSLDGSASTDADSDPLTYAWALIAKPAGSTAQLSDASLSNPSFTADVDGIYVAELVVNDGTVDSQPASVSVTASTANSAPAADAGIDQHVTAGTIVTLDGSSSSDADNDALTYAWTLVSKPTGSSAVLSGAADAHPSFTADLEGVYIAELVVSDGALDSSPASVTVTASVANAAPTANAGGDQSVNVGTSVSLDGTGSSDADNDPLTFSWTLISKPAASAVQFPSPVTTEMVFFTPDVAGAYVVQLMVNDGTVDSAPVAVTITATQTVPAPDGAALFTANCAGCHGSDGSNIVNLRGISAARIESTLPHKGVTLDAIEGTAGAQAIADYLGP